MRSILVFSVSAAASAALISAPATASDDRVSIAVPTHDLNLSTAAGLRALSGRIGRAARQICHTGLRSVSARSRDAACMADIREQAEAQLPGVTMIVLSGRRPHA